LTLDFPIIGSYLAWKVVEGSQVIIKANAIMGYGNEVFLTIDLIQHLQNIGRCTITPIGDPLVIDL
jgi:hypothetical protein